jgi:hypothetical protein
LSLGGEEMSAGKNRFGRKLGTLLGIASLVCAVGCIDDFDNAGDGQFSSGPSCTSLCERGQDCPGVSNEVDCADSCDELESEARRAGCGDEFDDFLSCVADISDACSTSLDECENESWEYSACMERYCNDNYEFCAEE